MAWPRGRPRALAPARRGSGRPGRARSAGPASPKRAAASGWRGDAVERPEHERHQLVGVAHERRHQVPVGGSRPRPRPAAVAVDGALEDGHAPVVERVGDRRLGVEQLHAEARPGRAPGRRARRAAVRLDGRADVVDEARAASAPRVRIPPPTVARPRRRRPTDPARARVMAAASPLGPEPTTTASRASRVTRRPSAAAGRPASSVTACRAAADQTPWMGHALEAGSDGRVVPDVAGVAPLAASDRRRSCSIVGVRVDARSVPRGCRGSPPEWRSPACRRPEAMRRRRAGRWPAGGPAPATAGDVVVALGA